MCRQTLVSLFATFVVASSVALVGCSEDPEPPTINQNGGETDAGPDADAGDTDPGPDHDFCTGCTEDGDCEEGDCLELVDGERGCGLACDPEAEDPCPDNAYCALLDEEAETGQCVPEYATCDTPCDDVTCPEGEYCAPSSGECVAHPRICDTGCTFDAECGDPDEYHCISTGAPDGETMCTTSCDPNATGEEEDLECPSDYICAEAEEGSDEGVCYPIDQTCTDRCQGVECGGGENCNPVTGECVEATTGACGGGCEIDAECEGQNDMCLNLGIGDGPRCWQNCTESGSCPAGYECSSLLGLTDSLCLPENQQCDPCEGLDCHPEGVCDPTAGECVPHPEDCTQEGCDDGQLCEPTSRRCVARDRTCSGDSWATDCDNVVTRCTTQTEGTEGVCATICDGDDDCRDDRTCEETQYGSLCMTPNFGGPDACGVTARAGQDVGQPCEEGDCSDDAFCMETGGVPGFCTTDCTDATDCPGDATCGIGPDGNSVCLPTQCQCAGAPALPDQLSEGWQTALDELELTACDLYVPSATLQEGGDWTDRAMVAPQLLELMTAPPAGLGTMRRHVDNLDKDAGDPAAMIGTSTELSGLELDAPDATTGDSALADAIVALDGAAGGDLSTGDFSGELDDLPADVETLAADLVVAIREAYQARDQAFADAGIDETTLQTLFDQTHRLVLPTDTDQQALDLSDGDVSAAIEDFPLEELGQIAADLTAAVDQAIADADLDPSAISDSFGAVIDTAAGPVVIGDTGDDTWNAAADADLDGPTALVLEVGGDDTYRLPVAANQSVDNGISTLVDLGGADTYSYPGGDAGDGSGLLPADGAGRIAEADADDNGTYSLSETARQGAGRLGVGLLFDRGSGQDDYRTLRLGQGAGILGVGGLFDAGDNTANFEAEAFAQGAALHGIGLLHSAGGDDTYRIWHAGQGFGAGRGAGLVYDADGHDEYTAVSGTDDLFLYFGSAAGPTANNNLAQGVATGTDAIGAGTGVLRDAAGDDTYSAASRAQGFGRHLGAGILADADGDDSYDARTSTQGTGIEAGAGLLWDAGGSDSVNQETTPQVLGQGSGQYFGYGFFLVENGPADIRSGTPGGGVGWDGGLGVLLADSGPSDHSNIGGGLGYSQFDASGSSDFADVWTTGIFVQTGGTDDTYSHPADDNLDIENDNVWRQDVDDAERAVGVGVDQ